MASFAYREFRPADLPRIKEITIAAFDGVSIDRNIDDLLGDQARQDWQTRKVRHLDTDLARENAMILVAAADEQVIGYVTTWLDQASGQGFIPNLAVDVAWRGQGIGKGLLEAAIEHFRRRGAAQVRIETLQQNPVGQKLYPSLGFREVARQIHYCLNLNDDA